MSERTRNDVIREFFNKNPDCTTPSECNKEVSELFDCSESAARAARYRIYPKDQARPWEPESQSTRFEGVEKAVPTKVKETGKSRPRLVFENGFPLTELPHECPRTGITANTLEEAAKLFGWRCTGEYEDGTPRYIVQSWSRKARVLAIQERRST